MQRMSKCIFIKLSITRCWEHVTKNNKRTVEFDIDVNENYLRQKNFGPFFFEKPIPVLQKFYGSLNSKTLNPTTISYFSVVAP